MLKKYVFLVEMKEQYFNGEKMKRLRYLLLVILEIFKVLMMHVLM